MDDVLLQLGPPLRKQALSDSIMAFVYPISNRDEVVWIIFGYFSKWYPTQPRWAIIFPDKVPIVVNISYYPLLKNVR